MQAPAQTMEYLYHHVFLPPKLPQHEDFDYKHEKVLLDVVRDALLALKKCCNAEHYDLLRNMLHMVNKLKGVVDSSGNIIQQELQASLTALLGSGKLIQALSFLCQR